MPPNIGDFARFTGATRVQYQDTTGNLVESGAKPKTLFGRFVDWVCRKPEERLANTETTRKFVETLKVEFGEEIANTASAGLASHISKGKPLTGRRIHEVIDQAERLRATNPKKSLEQSQTEGVKLSTEGSTQTKQTETVQKPKFYQPPSDPRESEVRSAMGFQYPIFRVEGVMGVRKGGLEDCGLTGPELASIYAYTTSDRSYGYRQLNNALRKFQSTDQSLGPLEPVIKTATTGLAKLPDYNGQVFRILNDPIGSQSGIQIMSQYQKGAIITEKGFTSTSHAVPESVRNGTHTGQYCFLIESVHGKNVESLSAHPNETEVLFKPLTRFQVTDRLENQDGSILIKMKEVPDEEDK